MKSLAYYLLTAAVLFGASPLEQPVGPLHLEKVPFAEALRALGRISGTPVLAEPEVTGEVTLDLARGTLRSALDALTGPAGYHYEVADTGIVVRRLKTVLYTIDYPQLTRSGSGSASVTLGGATGQGSGYPQPTAANSAPVVSNGTVSDATQISISQENSTSFWSTFEAELRAMLRDGDSLVLNRFSGVAQITATLPRHEAIRAYIALVNRRITRQVEIEARLVEVTLQDEQKLGIDWDLAAGAVRSVVVNAKSPVDVTGVGGTTLAPNTFTANLGGGKVSAIIAALRRQGEVRTVAQPRLRALNNQTSFIKVGQDQPFFRLQESTTFQQGGTRVPVNQTQEQFTIATITIGTILAVTPQIDGEGVITLDVLPAITRLEAVVTSPDGRQTAPLTDVKQASTIVRLRDGETAVIGGLISEEAGEVTRAVPVLGRVPVVGAAFRSQAKLRKRSELVIFLTPRLVP